MAKKNGSGSVLRNNKIILAGIALLLVFVFVGFLTFLKSFYQTETYYVLNDKQGETIPARTVITPDMLTPLVIAKDTAPPNALDISQVDGITTKYALKPGDVLTASNAGKVDDIYNGVPDSWVITNFSVGADNAVGGRIHPGDYFDIMVADEDLGSYYPFINVLALDTTVDLASATNANAANTAEAYKGQTTQYVVAMSPENAAKLQNVVAKSKDKMRLLLSPKQNNYKKPALSDYSKLFVFDDPTSPIWPGKSDKGELTDSNFNPVKRNEKTGEPIGEDFVSRSGGNLKMSVDEKSAQGTTTNK
jgi:hypothetical protein